ELRHLLAVAQPDVRLLPVRPASRKAPLPLDLSAHRRGADVGDLRAEQLLDRATDVDLRRIHRDLQHQRAAVLAEDGRLLRDERAADDLRQPHDSTSCSRSMAARVATIRFVSITSRAVSRLLGTSRTPGRFRAASANVSSSLTSMASVRSVAPSALNSAAASRVFGA